jgi:hypothetical protein
VRGEGRGGKSEYLKEGAFGSFGKENARDVSREGEGAIRKAVGERLRRDDFLKGADVHYAYS